MVRSKYLFTGLDLASELNTALLSSQLLPVSICRVEDNATFFVQATAEDKEVTTNSVIKSFLNYTVKSSFPGLSGRVITD